MEQKEFIGSLRVAELLGISVRTVHRKARSGQISGIKLAGSTAAWVFNGKEIEEIAKEA